MNRVQLDPQICKYLPTWYKPVEEYQQICQTETAQLEALAAAIHAVKENFYFQTMNLAGVEMWEDVLRIIPNPSMEDLDFRRARVLNRITTKPPFTLGVLYQKLDELIGPGEWSVTVDYANYTLYIESAARIRPYSVFATRSPTGRLLSISTKPPTPSNPSFRVLMASTASLTFAIR